MQKKRDPKKIAIAGILLIILPFALYFIPYYYIYYSLFGIPLQILGFFIILFSGYYYYKNQITEKNVLGFLGSSFSSKKSFPYKRHDLIKATNWYRKELNMKNWRIMGDVTFKVSISEPKFRDPHTLHVLIRQVLENLGCIIKKNIDPTLSPVENSLMKEVSYQIDGGISGYMGKKPKNTYLFLGLICFIIALVIFGTNINLLSSFYLISELSYILALIFIIAFSVLGVVALYFWYKNKKKRSLMKIMVLEEGTYYIEWEIFGINVDKKVEKEPKDVNAELILTIGILPDANYPAHKGKNLFSNIIEQIREIFHSNNCAILEQTSSTENT